jgi:hypothetical protein
MPSPPAASDLFTPPPDFAGRLALIVAGLAALIARAFLRDPRLIPLIRPLHAHLTRTARRFAALMALLAAGRLPRLRRPGKSGPHHPRPRIPTTPAWLVATLHHEAAAYASQLSHLLDAPGMSELLDAAPEARRLLRPLCRMLGISDTALRAVARGATGVFPFKNPESVPAPSSPPESVPAPSPPPPPLHPPPCPRLRFRWPWYTKADAKPA